MQKAAVSKARTDDVKARPFDKSDPFLNDNSSEALPLRKSGHGRKPSSGNFQSPCGRFARKVESVEYGRVGVENGTA